MSLDNRTISPEPLAVRFNDDSFSVDLTDGRTMGIPLAWFPRLSHGSPELRAKVSLSRVGLHWNELDEDISVAGLLAGLGNRTRARKVAA